MRGESGGTSRRGRLQTRIPSSVAFALRANCGPWFLTGFLLMFVAFLLRDKGVRPDTFSPEVMIGIVIGAAGLGRTLGTLAASSISRISPGIAVVAALARRRHRRARWRRCSTACGRWRCSDWWPGLAQAIAKFSLDATIQHDVPTHVQASAFGRSDTTCQLAWVVGGFVGIALPLDPPRLGPARRVRDAGGVVGVRAGDAAAATYAVRPRPGRKPGTARARGRIVLAAAVAVEVAAFPISR